MNGEFKEKLIKQLNIPDEIIEEELSDYIPTHTHFFVDKM